MKFEAIADRIRKDVLTGRLEPGRRVPSEKDLAEGLAVSVQTVNKAIAVLVSSGVLVRKGAQGAFVADPVDLQRLRATCQLAIGLIYDASVKTIADSDRVLGRLTFHLQKLLSGESYAWTLVSRSDGDDFHDTIDSLDGVVTIGDVEPALIEEVAARRLPAVTFNRDFRARGLSSVLISTAAIGDLVDHLHACGHRRFLYVTNDAPRQVYAIRGAAFAHAVGRHGLTAARVVVPEETFKADRIEAGVEAALRAADAVFLPNDQMAIVLLQLLDRAGIRVPEDLSVCGHDDTLAGRHCPVPLTTVSYDLEAAAQAIVRTLGGVLFTKAGRAAGGAHERGKAVTEAQAGGRGRLSLSVALDRRVPRVRLLPADRLDLLEPDRLGSPDPSGVGGPQELQEPRQGPPLLAGPQGHRHLRGHARAGRHRVRARAGARAQPPGGEAQERLSRALLHAGRSPSR